jgi:hypothetical protein
VAADQQRAPLRTVTAAMAIAIIGVAGLGTTAVATSKSAAADSNGTTLSPIPNVSSAPSSGVGPNQRIIHWSGYTWLVWPPGQPGPETGNQMSSSAAAVHVDSKGRLHLAITKVDGEWRCAELQLLSAPASYGTYSWTLDTNTTDFAQSVVLGMFVYRPGSLRLTNEIDVEDSKFTHLHGTANAQFAIQPYYAMSPNHDHPYLLPTDQEQLYQQFEWLPGTPGHGIAKFQTRAGKTASSPVLEKWTYHGRDIPTPQGMNLYLNLWLNTNRPPTGGSYSAVIDSFNYQPAY